MTNRCFTPSGRVKVLHGATDGIFEVAGANVESVQASLVDAFNVPAWAVALVNGVIVSGRHWLQPNDLLEFVVPWGRKGGDKAEHQSDACKLLTVKEAAVEMKCSISFIYKLMQRGQLAFEKRGRRKLPLAESVAQYRKRSLVPAFAAPQVEPPTFPRRRYECLFNRD
jgi:excisionase family DNA binding protein